MAQNESSPEPQSPQNVTAGAAAETGASFVSRVTIVMGIASAFAAAFLLVAFAPSAVLLTFAAVWFGCVLFQAGVVVSRWTRLSQPWSVGLVVGAVVAASIGFIALLGVQIADQIDDLVQNLGDSVTNLRGQLEQYPTFQRYLERTRSPEQVVQVVGGQSTSSVAALLLTPVGLLINTLFIFFTGVYLAFSPTLYRDGFVALFPLRQRPRVRQVCSEASTVLWRWTLVRLFSMALIGTSAGIGLWLLGVPMAATLGVLTALFQFVPNVGPVLAAVAPLLISVGVGPWTPLYVLLLYIGLELVESYLITPILHQKEDALPAALTIVAQLLLGILFGLLGVTFAMPVALVAMLFLQRFYVERGLENDRRHRPLGGATD